tara:strand:+ start:20823 stop:21728 length:906 start_codon:yes stop_codon:yes gene_type:complete
MNLIKALFIISIITSFTSCKENTPKKVTVEPSKNITQKVDDAVQQLEVEISDYKKVVSLDHHRMAAEVGVYTPPSIATIFSDAKIDINLVQENQLIALDLPFKVLCYAEPDILNVKVAYTSAEFIQKRHNLDPALLKDYNATMTKVIASFPKEMIVKTDLTNVNEGFGTVSIKSDFDFTTTVENLRTIVMSQGDTKWFADVDYQKDASAMEVTIRPTTLLLFGGPAPGGKAMMTSPKIGLDAFCQKLLVYENENGEVWLAYNDIVVFANLYYQTSTKPQNMINQRLKMTFTKAVTTLEEEE